MSLLAPAQISKSRETDVHTEFISYFLSLHQRIKISDLRRLFSKNTSSRWTKNDASASYLVHLQYGVQTSENTLKIKGFKIEFKPEMYGLKI